MLEEFLTLSLKKLKVGLDARSLANLEKSGVEGYVADLVNHLPATGPEIEWRFFVDKRSRGPKPTARNVKFVRVPVTDEKKFWPLVAAYSRLNKLSLFHFPIALVPENFPVPAVITIYDLASEVYPQFYSPSELEIHRQKVKRSVQTLAAGILTISEATKKDVIRFYHGDPRRIFVTYLSPNITNEIKQPKYDFDYILCVGNIQPRKNFPNAVKALASLKNNQQLHLVIAGKYQGKDELERISAVTREAGVTDRVHITGYISRPELNGLFARAKLLLYPSFYEGFGIPLLEGFHFGLPIVTANTSSMPEIAKDAAEYCNPASTSSIAKAIELALTPGRAHSLVDKGKQRLAELSRESLAESTLKAYQTILNEVK